MEDRVRLFNKGDALATAAKKRKLKREYKDLNQLSQFIYWTDIGREGASRIHISLFPGHNRPLAPK